MPILISLVIAGVVLWLINTYIPMDSKIKTILNVVVVIIVMVWMLNAFRIFGPQSSMHIGGLHMWW
jgi:Ca2+/H+ antiporter